MRQSLTRARQLAHCLFLAGLCHRNLFRLISHSFPSHSFLSVLAVCSCAYTNTAGREWFWSFSRWLIRPQSSIRRFFVAPLVPLQCLHSFLVHRVTSSTV